MITFAPQAFISFNYSAKNLSSCALGEGRMVVGRTLWDFIIEAFQKPGFGMILIALLISFEVLLILILLLADSGFIDIRFSYGGLGLELHHMAAWLA